MAAFLATVLGAGWTLAAFVLALSIIVAVHEYGHYIIGRAAGIKAEVFSLGFGPTLASRRDARGTIWQIAAIPLGGYVRFAGDKDAASVQTGDISALSPAEARATMAGAPLWARAATVAAGPLFNFALAFLIFAAMVQVSGLPTERAIVGQTYDMPFENGLMVGDEVLAIGGAATPDLDSYYKVAAEVPAGASVTYTVLRAGSEMQITAPHPLPARVGSVHPQNAAMRAGMREGDVILQANGQGITRFADLPDIVGAGAGAPVALRIWRAGEEIDLTLTPNRRDLPLPGGGFETRWLVGLSSGPLFALQTRAAGPWETVTLAAKQVYAILAGSLSGFAHLISGDISTCNISGPVGIAGAMGDAARSGVESFVSMLAMISLGVGLLNLMPIPVLDGGHLLFFAYEAITRRKPSAAVMNIAVALGLFFVLAMTVFGLGNDLTCR